MGYTLTTAAAEGGILRLSVWEMSTVRDRLLAAGGASPRLPGYAGPSAPADYPRDARHDEPGIPAYKLVSLDDWHVLPAEIAEALVAIEVAGLLEAADLPPPRAATWARFVTFLRLAEAAGGFVVS